MLFTEVLSKHKLTADSVSHSIKVKIKRYEKFSTLVESERQKLPTAKDNVKEKIEADIRAGEENMTALNEDICASIEKYVENYEANQKRVENIRKARENNKAKHGNKANKNDPPANDPPANDPPANDPPANDPPANDPPANDPPKDEKKKSGIGWLLGAVAVIGLGALGVHVYNKNK